MSWSLPPTDLLSAPNRAEKSDIEQHEQAAKQGDYISEKLSELGARCNCEKIDIGPQVIRFSMVAAEGVKVRDVPKCKDDLQYELGSKFLKIHAPEPGEKFITIEIPNPNRRIVRLGDCL